MGAAGLALGTHGLWLPGRGLAQTSTDPSYPFKLGVASGDPLPNSVVLWTRLTPGNPLTGGGTPASTTVTWQVAADASFATIVRSGTATASSQFAYSLHIDAGVQGTGSSLASSTTYYYRFKNGIYTSPTGRTKTAPASGASPSSMRLAFASCQHWESGLYPAYRHMAQQSLDLVVHLGDYIYEGAPTKNPPIAGRQHSAVADSSWGCNTLADYRNRHAQYKTDPNLQAAHAQHPWVCTWDDHEVENDYAGTKSWYRQSDFAQRRANAYRAYYEHMPLRDSVLVRKTDGTIDWSRLNLYRSITYGTLAQLLVLDLRQYRTEQPCGDQGSLIETSCKDRLQDPITRTNRRHTILGGPTLGTTPGQDAQEIWLKGKLTSSGPTWNAIAQQVIMFQYDHRSWYGNWYSESWDSYVATRDRILRHIVEKSVRNPIVLTGDMHSSWAANLESSFNDTTNTDIIGSEFAGTSISSGLSTGSGSWDEIYRNALTYNKHVKYYNGRTGGYVLCKVTPQYWQSDYYVADSLSSGSSPVSRRASWYAEVPEPNRPKLGVRAGTPLG